MARQKTFQLLSSWSLMGRLHLLFNEGQAKMPDSTSRNTSGADENDSEILLLLGCPNISGAEDVEPLTGTKMSAGLSYVTQTCTFRHRINEPMTSIAPVRRLGCQ